MEEKYKFYLDVTMKEEGSYEAQLRHFEKVKTSLTVNRPKGNSLLKR